MTKNKIIGWVIISVPLWMFLGMAIITNSVVPFLIAFTIFAVMYAAICGGVNLLFKD